MRPHPKLALKREVLNELTTTELRGVAAGDAQTQGSCAGSCLTWVSCHLTECLISPTWQLDCIGSETVTC